MTYEHGSFNWYKERPSKFFENLIRAVIYADGANILRMYKAFPHIGKAHHMENWDIAPDCVLPIILNYDRVTHKSTDGKTMDGSFARYLNRSGQFVIYLSRAICWADDHNIKEIEKQYPQMIAAFKRDDWTSAPEGFVRDEYNARCIEEVAEDGG